MDGTVNPLERPLTVGTCLVAAAVSIAWWLDYDVSRLFMDSRALSTEPWRLITSAVVHSGMLHLLFNGVWMFRLGTLLEGKLGAARYGLLFLVLAAASGAAEFAIFEGGVGLSGVVYGFFGFLWAARKSGKAYAAVADDRTTAMFVGWFFFCIVATYTGVLPIANVAHGVGGVLGVAAGFAVSSRKWRIAGWVGTGLIVAGSFAGATVLRPTINFSNAAPARADWKEADDAIAAGDYETALKHYRLAVDASPDDWRLWYNLGIAYGGLKRYEEALQAYKKAHELGATADTRQAVGSALSQVGGWHLEHNRLKEACASFAEAREVTPESAAAIYGMASCLTDEGKTDAAEKLLEELEDLPQSDAGAR